jgi:lipopolysaccharide export system protein LptC
VGDAILTAFSEIEPPVARVFTRSGGGNDRAFRRAARHSARVRTLRIAVPALAVLAAVGTIVLPVVLSPFRMLSKLPVDLGSVVVSGSKIMMQQPRIAGFTRDNRRYDLTAQAAGQDLTKRDMVELQGIHATMEMKDDSVVQATARDGLYNSKTELLTLNNDIVVTSSKGLEALLSEAVLDTREGRIVSEKPVVVKTASWNVNANRMEITDSGDVMRFERGVVVLLLGDSPVRYEARGR